MEAKVAQDGVILTEAQLQAEAQGEIETQASWLSWFPRYLFYVGNFKGVGKVYQQIFVDTYSRVADAKLYTEKTAISAADMLNDRVLPFYLKI